MLQHSRGPLGTLNQTLRSAQRRLLNDFMPSLRQNALRTMWGLRGFALPLARRAVSTREGKTHE
jgi:hypothetical protein